MFRRIGRKIVRQLGDVAGDTPRLVHGEHMGRVSISSGFSAIDVGKRLSVSVLHRVAARDLLNLPWGQHARGPRWHSLPSAFHYAAWPMFELYAIMPIGWIPRRTLCGNRVGFR